MLVTLWPWKYKQPFGAANVSSYTSSMLRDTINYIYANRLSELRSIAVRPTANQVNPNADVVTTPSSTMAGAVTNDIAFALSRADVASLVGGGHTFFTLFNRTNVGTRYVWTRTQDATNGAGWVNVANLNGGATTSTYITNATKVFDMMFAVWVKYKTGSVVDTARYTPVVLADLKTFIETPANLAKIGKGLTVTVDGIDWYVIKKSTYGTNNRSCVYLLSKHPVGQSAEFSNPNTTDYLGANCLYRKVIDNFYTNNMKQLKEMAILPILQSCSTGFTVGGASYPFPDANSCITAPGSQLAGIQTESVFFAPSARDIYDWIIVTAGGTIGGPALPVDWKGLDETYARRWFTRTANTISPYIWGIQGTDVSHQFNSQQHCSANSNCDIVAGLWVDYGPCDAPGMPISISGQASVCAGGSAETYSISSVSGATNYTWTLPTGWTGSSTGTTISATPGLGAQSGYITVKANNDCDSSAEQQLYVTVSQPTVGGSVSGGTSVCASSNSTLLTLSGHTGSITRWESSTDGGTTWTNIANTNNTYTATNLNTTTQFRAVIQNGVCAPANSLMDVITVNQAPSVGKLSPHTPQCSGDLFNMSKPVMNDNGSTITSDGWQIETEVNTNLFTDMPAIYVLAAADNNKRIRYHAINGCGTGYSDTVALDVNPLPTVILIPAHQTILVDSTYQLTPNTGGTWTSSNNAIATVTNVGLVTGISPGKVAFTFTSTATNCSNTTDSLVVSNKVQLNLKVFLEGVTKAGGIMTNYIQEPGPLFTYSYFTEPRLPLIDPYNLGTIYPHIKDFAGPAGQIVDWVQVEIWGNINTSGYPYTYDLLEKKALLLKPDGSIVGIDGTQPLFDPQTGIVHIIIKHRNHLSVMSNPIANFTAPSVVYDFSSSLSQAYRVSDVYDPDPMIEVINGVWCMWAGDLNGDELIDNNDLNPIYVDFTNSRYDEYIETDINMDGLVDNTDVSTVHKNFQTSRYSPLFHFVLH
jgi:hypothetical protein